MLPVMFLSLGTSTNNAGPVKKKMEYNIIFFNEQVKKRYTLKVKGQG